MTKTPNSESVHATCIAIDGLGVMLTGPSGCGKSDLALRLIDRDAKLISDDYVTLSRDGDAVMLSTPPETAGKLEIWSLGIYDFDHISNIPLGMKVKLGQGVERFPMDSQMETILGKPVTTIALKANEPSAPIKVEMALKRILEGVSG